jgi:hypothetical protein
MFPKMEVEIIIAKTNCHFNLSIPANFATKGIVKDVATIIVS